MNPTDYLARLNDDFLFFVREIWRLRGLDKKAPLGPLELDMCRWLATGPRFRGIIAPRGSGKTYLVAVFCCWRLFRDPDRNILIVSKSYGQAKRTIKLIRQWIDLLPFLRHLKPNPDQIDSADQFVVAQSSGGRVPSCFAVGIGSQLPSNRAHTIIPDDVETPENTKSIDTRNDLEEIVKEFVNILYPHRPHADGGPIDPSEIVYLGTYHHEDSLYLKRSKAGVAFRTWPILYPTPAERDSILNLAPSIADALDSGSAEPGDLTMPLRFSDEVVNERKAEGYRNFAMQNMGIANLGETNRYPLRLADLIVTHVDPFIAPTRIVYGTHDHAGSTEITDIDHDGFNNSRFYRPVFISQSNDWAPYTANKGYIDPSGRGSDHTAAVAVGALAAHLFVKGLLSLPGGFDEPTLDELCVFFRDTNTREIYIEGNWGGEMYQELFEPRLRKHFLQPNQDPRFPKGWTASVTAVRSSGIKELRVCDTLEPPTSTHRLVIDRSVAEQPRFQFQFSRIQRIKKCLEHDDDIDALAGAVAAFEGMLRRDPIEAAQRAREQRTLDAIKKAEAEMGWLRRPARMWKRA